MYITLKSYHEWGSTIAFASISVPSRVPSADDSFCYCSRIGRIFAAVAERRKLNLCLLQDLKWGTSDIWRGLRLKIIKKMTPKHIVKSVFNCRGFLDTPGILTKLRLDAQVGMILCDFTKSTISLQNKQSVIFVIRRLAPELNQHRQQNLAKEDCCIPWFQTQWKREKW